MLDPCWCHRRLASESLQALCFALQIIAITLFMDSPAASSLLGRSFAGIVTYNMLYSIANAFRPAVELLLRRNPRSLWRFHRTLEKWEYGSARDYKP